ncbi:MAG: hypothetical protein J7M25_02390 [Deltaproteobacteria bacterium]|nr:hypothetical protein [Deltaproteobacteria bacterium]
MQRARHILLILTSLWVLVGPTGSQALAGPSSLRSGVCRQAKALAKTRATYARQKVTLLSYLKRLRTMAKNARTQTSSLARTYRMRTILAQARALSQRLEQLDRRIRSVDAHAKRLVGSGRALSARQPKAQARRTLACVALLRSFLEPSPSQHGPSLSAISVSPNDGPMELRRKADLMADAADKLERKLRRLDAAIHRTERQVSLRQAARRSESGTTLWGTDGRRRTTAAVTATPSVHRVSGDVQPSTEGGHGRTDQSIGGHYYGSNGGGTNGTVGTQNAATPVDDGGSSSLATTWSHSIASVRDLVTPQEAARLNQIMRTGSLSQRLAAMKRTRELLARKRRAMQRRSRLLRNKVRKMSGPRRTPKHPRTTRASHPSH